MNGNGPLASLGVKMVVYNFTPSRMAIMCEVLT